MSSPNVIEELRVTIAKMEEELRTVKIENQILKNKINELTSLSSSATATLSSSRRGCFGYGADEF